MTLRELAKLEKLSLYTLRRHARIFLKPDKEAKKQGGKARNLSEQDCKDLLFVGLLVALKVPVKKIKSANKKGVYLYVYGRSEWQIKKA